MREPKNEYNLGRDEALQIVQRELDELGFGINDKALRDSLEGIREEIINLRLLQK